MTHPAPPLGPGSRVGDYELLAEIGAGGMGTVWVARSMGAIGRARLVAVKTAHVKSDGDGEYWKMLFDEARIASRVNHPNVCGVHNARNENGLIHLVMDWSDGGTMHELLRSSSGKRVSPTIAARIGARVCAGLHAVHDLRDDAGELMNVVHRDVSPQNILIATSGQVRLTDFGVAKARGQLQAPTETGEVKGKIAYMAPEQVTSRDIDRRVDVFALGCVLYEATTGTRPFSGEDALSTLYRLLEQPITPPSEVVRDYPIELEQIVMRALAREASERYQTADEMGHALELFLASEHAIVGDSDVGKLLRRSLADRIAERERAIDQAAQRLDSASTPRTAPPSELAARETSNRLPPGKRRRPAGLVGLGVAAVAVSVLVLAARNPFTESAVASSDPPNAGELRTASVGETRGENAPRQDTARKVTEADSVQVALRATPSDAVWYLDDKTEPLPNPHLLEMSKGTEVHQLRAIAPGHEAFRTTVTFDSNKELHAQLRPEARQARPPKRRHAADDPKVAKRHAATPTVTAPTQLPPKPEPSSPTTTGTGVRELDVENPYKTPAPAGD